LRDAAGGLGEQPAEDLPVQHDRRHIRPVTHGMSQAPAEQPRRCHCVAAFNNVE
jgi:hypothetical protein